MSAPGISMFAADRTSASWRLLAAALAALWLPLADAHACTVPRSFTFTEPPNAILGDGLQLLHVRVVRILRDIEPRALVQVLEDGQGLRTGQVFEAEGNGSCADWGEPRESVYIIGYLRRNAAGRLVFDARSFPDRPAKPQTVHDPNLPVFDLPQAARPVARITP